MPVIDLFSPIEVGSLSLPNRIVMAPMTRNRAGIGNVPTPLMAEYYRQRATAGLIVTEATQVSPQGVGYPNTPGIHSEAQVQGWRHVTEAVHGEGGRICLQLWHVGRISHPSLQPGGGLPVAPSAIRPNGDAMTYEGPKPFETPRALESAELPGIVEAYRLAAVHAREAGFDGVEIHGANGYLLDQFLRDGANRRSDAYGGSVMNRARLMLEVTQAVCGAFGPGCVGLRISPLQPFNDMRDSDPETTFAYLVRQLNHLPLAYLHVTEMGKGTPGAAGPDFDLQKLRQLWKGVYMTNGSYDRERAMAVVRRGEADLVAFGIPFIANPDLVARFMRRADLNAPDPATFYGGNAEGYTDYPTL